MSSNRIGSGRLSRLEPLATFNALMSRVVVVSLAAPSIFTSILGCLGVEAATQKALTAPGFHNPQER
jgi:hypothetical protein